MFPLDGRMSSDEPLDNTTIEGSSVLVNMDMTNQQIELTIATEIMQAFQRFVDDVERQLKVPNPEKAQIPIVVCTTCNLPRVLFYHLF